MGKRIDWTDAQLRSAVANARSWRQVAALLGLAPGSTHRVHKRATELGLDASHLTGNRRWDPSALKTAVADAASWKEVATLLGSRDSDVGRIRGAARRHGIDARHLDRADPANRPALPVIDPRRFPVAAEALAAAWFIMIGLRVSVPTMPSSFDLIVSGSTGHRRVQVKSTSHRDNGGRWLVVVAHRPYRSEISGRREPYDPDEVDDFFIITADGDCFLIPTSTIAGRISIVLDCYRIHRVGNIGDIFSRSPTNRIVSPSATSTGS